MSANQAWAAPSSARTSPLYLHRIHYRIFLLTYWRVGGVHWIVSMTSFSAGDRHSETRGSAIAADLATFLLECHRYLSGTCGPLRFLVIFPVALTGAAGGVLNIVAVRLCRRQAVKTWHTILQIRGTNDVRPRWILIPVLWTSRRHAGSDGLL